MKLRHDLVWTRGQRDK